MYCRSKSHFSHISKESKKCPSEPSFWRCFWNQNPSKIDKHMFQNRYKKWSNCWTVCFAILTTFWSPRWPPNPQQISHFLIVQFIGAHLAPKASTPPRQPKGSDFKGLGTILDSICWVSFIFLKRKILKFWIPNRLLRHGGGLSRAAHWVSAGPAKRCHGRLKSRFRSLRPFQISKFKL